MALLAAAGRVRGGGVMHRWTGGVDEPHTPAPCGQILAALALAAAVAAGLVLLVLAVKAVH